MKTLVIIPCGKSKIWDRHPKKGPVLARFAYCSTLFKVNRAYAEKVGTDWIILSAKYGFIPPDFEVPGPYEVSFKLPDTNPISLSHLRKQVTRLPYYDRIIGLGGAEYRERIEQAFAPLNVDFPFAGLDMFAAVTAVKQATPKGFWS